MPVPPFPGKTLRASTDTGPAVLAVQRRLAELGTGAVPQTGTYDAKTRSAVRLFQARFTDTTGVPLLVDGHVGPITWASLFSTSSDPEASAPLAVAVLATAGREVGVMEEPAGSNRGPRVDQYLRSVGLDPTKGSFAWCAAFVYWCYEQASQSHGTSTLAIRTAGVLDLWRQAERQGLSRLSCSQAISQPERIVPGMVFVLKTGAGTGHTGIVEAQHDGKLSTIEGNTNEGGSREGIGVFRHSGPSGRKVNAINLGFIDYG